MIKPFEKIKLSQLHTLCNTLADAEVRDVSNIKRKYLESALSFDETLSLLKDLKIVRTSGNELKISKSFSLPLDSIEEFKKIFIPVFFHSNGDISEELRIFLSNFQAG